MKQIFFYSILVMLCYIAIFLITGSLASAVEVSLGVSLAGLLFIGIKYSGKYLTGAYRAGVIIILIAGSAGILLASYVTIENAFKQKESLLTVGGQISEGELLWKLKDISIKTLKEYYGGNEKKSLAETFSSLYPVKEKETNAIDIIYNNYDSSKATGSIVIDTLETGKITLIAQSRIFKGIDADYKNFGGNKGMVQIKMRITEKGGHYEIQN